MTMTSTRSRSLVFMVGSTVLSALACGGGEKTIEPPPPCPSSGNPIASVTVTASTSTLDALGATVTLTASAKNAQGANCSPVTFGWSSSAPGVVSVDQIGVATAVANGDVSVTATADGKSGSVSLKVAQKIDKIDVTPTATTLEALGATAQLSATGKDRLGSIVSGATFTWSSSAQNVATVDASGLAKAVANGDATITATADGKSGSAALKIAQKVVKINVTPTADTLEALGATVQLSATALDPGGSVVTGRTFTWTSSAIGVINVSAGGEAKAVGNGTASAIAMIDAVSGTASLVVAQRVTAVAVTPATATIAAGETQQFAAAAADANGNPVTVAFLWVSSNHNVAIIDGSGLATGVNGGNVTITAAGQGVPATAALIVSAAPAPVAHHLVFTRQPTSSIAGSAIPSAVEVEIRTESGQLVTSARNSVTIAIGTNSGGGMLSGTTTVHAVNGIASFSGLSIDKSGPAYTLVASSSGLIGTMSDAFVVAPVLALSQASVSFSAVIGGDPPDAVAVDVTSSGGASEGLAASIAYATDQPTDWLAASLSNTTAAPGAAATLILESTVGTLVPGTYNATVTVSSTTPGATSRSVAVTFTVAAPVLALDRESITFSATAGGANPAAEQVAVTSPDGVATGLAVSIQYAAGQATGWLSTPVLSQTSTPATLTLQAQTVGLAAGSYSATVTVSSTTPGVVSKSLTVTFAVSPQVVTYGNSSAFSATTTHSPNLLLGSRIKVEKQVTLTHLAQIAKTGGPARVKMGLYTDAGGTPGTLVAQTGPTTLAVGNLEMAVSGPSPTLAAGDYWIVAVYDLSVTIGFGSSGPWSRISPFPFANSLPTTFSATESGTNFDLNYYIKGTIP